MLNVGVIVGLAAYAEKMLDKTQIKDLSDRPLIR